MKNDMIWGYLIHLSANLWGDSEDSKAYEPYRPQFVTDDEVWKQTVDYLPSQGFNTVVIDLGDGVQYESHPEIAIPGAWSKDKLKAELDRMRSIGLTPLPKLNFSACHDVWMKDYSRMLSTKPYYEFCKDIITEVAELFGNPELFHLGLDEEVPELQTHFIYSVCRQGELWWHDAYYLFDLCDKVGARPWVWADLEWIQKEKYLQKMPKSVMQSNWWYRNMDKKEDGSFLDDRINAYHDLDKAGFDQIPTCSSVFQYSSAELTLKTLKEDLDPAHLRGYMTAPWFLTTDKHRYGLLNDAHLFGEAKKKYYPEYCK